MHNDEKPPTNSYPTGRGYGNDYMRGGEVFGGYGYSSRPEYERRRGDSAGDQERRRDSAGEQDRQRDAAGNHDRRRSDGHTPPEEANVRVDRPV